MNRIAVLLLGATAFAGAGCHSSSPGVMGNGGAGGNAHGDGASDVATGSGGAGGGGGITGAGGGAGAGGAAGGNGDAAGTGSGGAGAADAASDAFGAGCNTLTTPAPVTVTCAPDGGVAAAPTGGTIVPGTYALTAVTQYGACTALAIAQTLVVTATTFDTVVDSALTGLSRENFSYTVSGTTLVQTPTCPAPTTPTTDTFGYSVTTAAGVTTMTLISGGAAGANVGVYTKQ